MGEWVSGWEKKKKGERQQIIGSILWLCPFLGWVCFVYPRSPEKECVGLCVKGCACAWKGWDGRVEYELQSMA